MPGARTKKIEQLYRYFFSDENGSKKKISPTDRGNINFPIKDGLLGMRDVTVIELCLEMVMKD